MARHIVCPSAELPAGAHRVVEVGGREIGVYHVDGEHFAVRSRCPHHGAPLCAGPARGTMLPSDVHRYVYGMDGQVVRCPWHGFEFDLRTGRSLADPERFRVKTYPVKVEDGDVVLYV
jgi:nitrite reductase/ring-hydroxylating ferredoxin subunit